MTATREDLESQINYLEKILKDGNELLNLINAMPSVKSIDQQSEVEEQKRRIAYDEKRLAHRRDMLAKLKHKPTK